MASVSYTDEASETFACDLDRMQGWIATITPAEGDPFDAMLLGSGADETGDYFGVRVSRWTEDDGAVGEPFAVVVKDITVH